MHHSHCSTRRGSTLVTVTIMLGTMTVLALIFLRVGQRLGQEQDANLDSTRATLLAEAGISEAVEALRAGRSGDIGEAGEPAYMGGGVLWVEATDLGNGRIQLDSMAMKDSGRAALRVVVEDMGHYSRFVMETLLKHPSVEDCKTSFVLDQVKATTVVPV